MPEFPGLRCIGKICENEPYIRDQIGLFTHKLSPKCLNLATLQMDEILARLRELYFLKMYRTGANPKRRTCRNDLFCAFFDRFDCNSPWCALRFAPSGATTEQNLKSTHTMDFVNSVVNTSPRNWLYHVRK
jgi:hypothetical protein